MNPSIKRYVIPNYGSNVEPIRLALAHYIKLFKESKERPNSILLVPTQRQMSGTVIEEAIGTDASKRLLKGDSAPVQSAGQLSLSTERSFRKPWSGEVLIVIYPTKKMLNDVDASSGASAVVVVPWIMEDVSEWVRSWNPVIAGKEFPSDDWLNISSIVEQGLKALTGRVNLSTGLANPSDKAAAVSLFKMLAHEGESLDADAIRAWAIRNTWTPAGADDLRNIVDGVITGKRFRISPGAHWASNIIEILRERTTAKPS